MKKIILLFAFTCILNSLCAQIYLNELAYIKVKGKVKEIVNKNFDAVKQQGKITAGASNVAGASGLAAWPYISADDEQFQFDNLGNLTFRKVLKSDWGDKYETSYDYDKTGKISVSKQRNMKTADAPTRQYTFDYDKNGKLVKRTVTYKKDLNWNTYLYNANGTIKEESDSALVVLYGDKAPTKKIWKNYTYTYNDKQQLTEVNVFSEGNFEEKVTYTYSTSGLPSEVLYYDYDKKLKSKETLQFDAQGNLSSINIYIPKFKENRKYSFTYKYDQDNNWTERIIYDAGKPVILTTRTITYY